MCILTIRIIWVYNDTLNEMRNFKWQPTLIRPKKCNTRWLANPKREHSHFLHDFGAHMNILFIIKENIHFSFRWPYQLK